jgi:hypothetical protein
LNSPPNKPIIDTLQNGARWRAAIALHVSIPLSAPHGPKAPVFTTCGNARVIPALSQHINTKIHYYAYKNHDLPKTSTPLQ